MKKKVVIFATYSLWDPPIQNSAIFFSKKSWDVIIIQSKSEIPVFFKSKDFKVIFVNDFIRLKKLAFLKAIFSWLFYWYKVKQILAIEKPDLIIAEMHRPLSVIPESLLMKTICFIPDIPSIKFSGKLDRQIIKYGWNKITKCCLIWTSDQHKAALTKQFARLDYLPMVCYNCPSKDYLLNFNKKSAREWLFPKLQDQGVLVTKDSLILLRAGAIGEYGGIEETILAMKELPKELIFVLMGRPENSYHSSLMDFIKKNKMTQRVCLFNRPDDIDWKQILKASDIGHLIHIRPDNNIKIASNYDLNSSLSNNRLFQYMAAGIPIISYNDPRMNAIHNEVNCFCIADIANFRKDLVHICSELMDNTNKRNSMGINAYEAFCDKFNWDKQFYQISKTIGIDK